ncbi:MAG TPA: hypothetical protein VD927_00560 [Chryseosolibacter sp.]|nr:hypothetical protein [Chryseosolibacter sp.]
MVTRQFSILLLVLFVTTAVLIAVVCFFAGPEGASMKSILFPESVLLVTYALFYQLKISVDDQRLSIEFGIGIIRRTFSLKRIASVDKVVNSRWYGYGIRYLPGITLYNVDGTAAIELCFKDTGRRVRIGTTNPDQLTAFIRTKI